MPAPVKCLDCKWCCLVTRHGRTAYECHLHPPVFDGMHEADKPCGWTFPTVDPGAEACSDSK